ncbi:hypothetical protein FJV41_47365 [Myxococcus llanfairpwllgwyngyllgogerychwyrndrobwllllantysiliogogogochensis]|uniref:Uncharacterized protein n=1 Tax=Myxococcus llanfairpwllgwyngyllgogerychwyrndrobwllllantysiliogogogochensis TaxID=2590453 RepID=A0A540WJ65_9BACT|nr:hypothetical protein [Myxococcus llanfairpwllgwyngyllgogerychwyrndrobwllllantysiliogogogochensis]TQF08917.1 hypothetical protein FJV41_47365 [Myxococcus llanfairpwllgwyngyllgogerychwyrndrobwllllantysiliogogogochensis]
MFVGTKYSAHRDGAEVAAAIRQDIKADQMAGRLPHLLKVSVTLKRFAGGQTLRISIRDAPIQVESSAYARSVVLNLPESLLPERYTPAAVRLRKHLERIALQYQRDASRPEEDYSNVNFFLRVGFAVGFMEVDHEIITDYWLALEGAAA